MHALEDLLAVIGSAIQNEVSGQQFYNDAAHYCIDPWAKEMFATLAKEEEVHIRLLMLEYQALTTDGCWIDPQEALVSDAEVDITHLIFPDDNAGDSLFLSDLPSGLAIDRRSDDLAALAFGIDMERKAIDLYERGEREARDASARKLYDLLAGEERQHLHQLKDRWDKLTGNTFGET